MEVFTMKIVVATKNNHKVDELKAMIDMPNVEFFSMKEMGVDLDIEENGTTFEENAMIKAEALYNALNDKNLIVIADDSGLCVDALNGAPGIYSARYSGGNDKDNNMKLLDELKDVPALKRGAHYVCCIALISQNSKELFTGKCYGLIDKEERGTLGFGYDPIFYVPIKQKTFGEIEADEKNKISHRANAVKLLKDWISKN